MKKHNNKPKPPFYILLINPPQPMVRVKKVRISTHKEECPVCEHLFDRGEREKNIRNHIENCIAMAQINNFKASKNGERVENPMVVKLPPISALDESVLDVDNVEANYGPAQYTNQHLNHHLPPQNVIWKKTGMISKSQLKENTFSPEFLLSVIANQQHQLASMPRCRVCLESNYCTPLVSTVCWHVLCEKCWLDSLRYKRVCPACSSITSPEDLRRIYL